MKKRPVVNVKVNGVSFPNTDGSSRQEHIKQAVKLMEKGPVGLSLKRESENSYDKNAIAVYWRDHQIGYVPAVDAKKLAPKMDRGERYTADIFSAGENKEGLWGLSITIYQIVKEKKR